MFGEFVGIPHDSQRKGHDRCPYKNASQDLHISGKIGTASSRFDNVAALFLSGKGLVPPPRVFG